MCCDPFEFRALDDGVSVAARGRVYSGSCAADQKNWNAEGRVAAAAEQLPGKANPRFAATTLDGRSSPALAVRADVLRAGGWRTGSRNASWTCSPTALPRRSFKIGALVAVSVWRVKVSIGAAPAPAHVDPGLAGVEQGLKT